MNRSFQVRMLRTVSANGADGRPMFTFHKGLTYDAQFLIENSDWKLMKAIMVEKRRAIRFCGKWVSASIVLVAGDYKVI